MHITSFRSWPILLALAAGCLAAPADAAENCQLKRVASMPMTMNASNQLLIHGRINDQREGSLFIDTGAVASTLRASVADELGLQHMRTTRGFTGAGGRAMLEGVSIKLQLGNLVSPDAHFLLVPNTVFSDPEVIGNFGEDYLANYDLELDFAGQKANLFSQDHCSGQVVYWAKEFVKVPFLFNESNQIELLVELDGVTLRAILDTGTSATLVGMPVAHGEFGLEPDSAGMEKIGDIGTLDGGRLVAYRYRFHKLDIGGLAFGNPQINIIPMPKVGRLDPGSHINSTQGKQEQIILGTEELRKLHLYIAYAERKIYLTPAGAGP